MRPSTLVLASLALLSAPAARAGSELVVQTGHATPVNELDFSSDGTRLVTTARERTVIVWDIRTGSEQLRLVHPGPASGAAFSPDGRSVAVVCDAGATHPSQLAIWDARTGAPRAVYRADAKAALVGPWFSADGREVWVGSKPSIGMDQSAIVVDPSSGSVKRTFKLEKGRLVRFDAGVALVALRVKGAPDALARLDPATGTVASPYELAGAKPEIVDVSNDGKLLALTLGMDSRSGTGAALTLRETATGKELLNVPGGKQRYLGTLALAPNAGLMVSGWNRTGNESYRLELRAVPSGSVVREIDTQQNDRTPSASFSPDGSLLAVAVAGGSWSCSTPRRVRGCDGCRRGCSRSPRSS